LSIDHRRSHVLVKSQIGWAKRGVFPSRCNWVVLARLQVEKGMVAVFAITHWPNNALKLTANSVLRFRQSRFAADYLESLAGHPDFGF